MTIKDCMRTILFLLLAEWLLAQPERVGLPSCAAPDQELAVRSAFTLCHSASLRVPVWTVYELTPERLAGEARRPRHFRRDTGLSRPGAADSDYRNSGYTRGHMVPAADVAWSEEALRDSFLLSNAVPQNGSLNSGKWRLLESAVRRLAATADSAIVFSGPIFCESIQRVGANEVAVPCQLYKVVLVRRASEWTAYAAILPNAGNPTEPVGWFACPVSEVERRTGLDFFHALPQDMQSRLESSARGFE